MKSKYLFLLAAALPSVARSQNMWTNGDFETPSGSACYAYSASSGTCATNWYTTGMNVRFLDNACNIERPGVSGTNPGTCYFPNATNPMSASGSGYSSHYFAHRSVWATGVTVRTFGLYQPLPANYTSYPFMHFSMNVATLRIGQTGGSVQIGIYLDNGSTSSCAAPTSSYLIYSASFTCDQVVDDVVWATMFANTTTLPSGYTRMLVKVAATRSNSSTVPVSVFLDDISFFGSSSMMADPPPAMREAPMLKNVSFSTEQEEMALFPNPAHDLMQLSYTFTDMNTAEVQVMDLMGRMVARVRPSMEGLTEVPVNDLASGQYILSVVDGDIRRQLLFARE